LEEKKVFVVGCFNFVPKDKSVELKDYDYSAYCKLVIKTLKSIPKIKNIEFTNVDGILKYFKSISPADEYDNSFYPYPSFGNISFDISIPPKKFKYYLDDYWATPHTSDFKIAIFYTPFAPFVIVEIPSSEKYPTFAFRILHRYLQEYFESNEFSLKFATVGASYFFILDIMPALNETLVKKYICELDNESITIKYNTSMIDSIGGAKNEFIYDNILSLAFLFKIRFVKTILQSQTSKFDAHVKAIKNKYATSNILYDFKGCDPKELKYILLENINLESNFTQYKEWLRDYKEDWLAPVLVEPLSSLVEVKLQNLINMKYPSDEIYKLINFFENRSISYKSITGGVIGGILVLALSMLIEYFFL